MVEAENIEDVMRINASLNIMNKNEHIRIPSDPTPSLRPGGLHRFRPGFNGGSPSD